jgi:hypothetical protein
MTRSRAKAMGKTSLLPAALPKTRRQPNMHCNKLTPVGVTTTVASSFQQNAFVFSKQELPYNDR